MNARDDRLADLAEALMAAIEAGENLDTADLAVRFDLEPDEIDRSLRAVRALHLSLDEDAPRNESPTPRPVISDDFELGDELGRGGMGVVYRAQQKSLGRAVAIKVLRHGAFDAAIDRFRAEARSLARLRHPHIVAIHGVGETESGLVYYIMDLVEGRTLADEMAAAGGALTPSRAVKIMRQVTSAIAHAHSQGIVHRDLKPQNILIDEVGDAFVVDFGLARDATAGPVTMTGELLGTPAYMSPEQARGDQAQIGEATDIWALGALLYEMLTGQGPFSGRPLHETIRAILEETPVTPRRLDRRIPAALEAVCVMALRKRSEQRYASAAALAEDLERFLGGVPVLARRPSRFARVGASVARHRVAWLAAVLACGVVITLFGWLAVPEIRRSVARSEARRALDAGYPGAAVEALANLGDAEDCGDRPFWSHERFHLPEIALDRLRAWNDRAAELIVAGRTEEAAQVLAKARKRARFATWGLGEHPSFASDDTWWEVLRTEALRLYPETFDATDFESAAERAVSRERWIAAYRSAHPHVRHAAIAVAAQFTDRVLGFDLDAPTTVDVAIDLHRFWAARCSSADERRMWAGSWRFPMDFAPEAIAAWWSPQLEDALADLAINETEDRVLRAFAFRTWSVFTGLESNPGWVGSFDSELLEREFAVGLAIDAVGAWRAWRELPRAEALSERIALLERARVHPESRFAQSLSSLVGRRDGDAMREAVDGLIARPRAWLLEALGVRPNDLPIGEALRRATALGGNDPMLWRHLAFLDLPAGARVPMALPESDGAGWPWARHWWPVLGLEPEREFVASLALVEVRNLADPRILNQVSVPLAVDEESWLELRAAIAPIDEVALASVRTRSLGRREVDYRDQLRDSMADGRFESRLRLRLGADPRRGLELEIVAGERGLKSFNQGDAVSATAVGAAVTVAALEWVDPDWQECSTFLLLMRLERRGPEAMDGSIDGWRRALALGVALDPSRGWETELITPRVWSVPEARAALERRARATGDWGAAMLAGAEDDASREFTVEPGLWAPRLLARVALDAPEASARERGLAELVAQCRRRNGRLALPAAAVARLRAEADLDDPRWREVLGACAAGVPEWTRRGQGWAAPLMSLLVVGFVLGWCVGSWPASWRLRSPLGSLGWWALVVAWSASIVALHTEIRIAGVVLTPAWLALAANAAVFLVGWRRRPASKSLAAAVLIVGGLSLWVGVAAALGGHAPSASWYSLPYLCTLAVLASAIRAAWRDRPRR